MLRLHVHAVELVPPPIGERPRGMPLSGLAQRAVRVRAWLPDQCQRPVRHGIRVPGGFQERCFRRYPAGRRPPCAWCPKKRIIIVNGENPFVHDGRIVPDFANVPESPSCVHPTIYFSGPSTGFLTKTS